MTLFCRERKWRTIWRCRWIVWVNAGVVAAGQWSRSNVIGSAASNRQSVAFFVSTRYMFKRTRSLSNAYHKK